MISIHAPHEGERRASSLLRPMRPVFQSTLPTRGSDYPEIAAKQRRRHISIHAPHEGERQAL